MKGFIIDDEAAPRLILKHLLNQITPRVEVVGEADNLNDGIASLKKLNIDVLFLDIEMPNHIGLEIIELFDGPIDFKIIFVTAYSEYAIQAFKLSAFDYLLKPLKKNELQETLKRLSENGDQRVHHQENLELLNHNLQEQNDQQYLLRTHREECIINIKNIISLEADGMYTNIVLKNDKITASKPMKDILADLPDSFFRTHRSFAVNLHHIDRPIRINNAGIKTTIGTYIPLSVRKRDCFMDAVDAKYK
jgi:two-component system LytT family response regulator